MKVHSSSFLKLLFVILFLIINFNYKTYSQYKNSKNNASNKFNELKGIKGLINKHNFYYKTIAFKETEKLIPIKKRIEYFEFLKEQNKNDKDIYYIDIILLSLYQNNNEIDKAIRFGLESYSKNNNLVDDDKMCQLLIIIENCYSVYGNNTGIVFINKEKLKRCNSGQILFHKIYFKMGLYDQALKSYKKNNHFNSKEFLKNDLFNKAQFYNNVGVYQMYGEKIDSALINYKTSLKLLELQKKKI
ncbi:hypothetical protein [Polaribacter ponticola]|uniref:Tetratricopeptide repeat protein n=1 Tax=Polaribacter ponticola TaxID=2978475 RepID=A0ABT5S9D8_9FLAO|nr:hypothetical protein [Polaribacter sp. MSW5]MDD7913907.1 hypothetical protein [Polaribacter sp. MSW5]